MSPSLYICWTTVSSLEDARRLAALAVESGLAACVQIDAACESVYRWEGETCRDEERRIWFKTVAANLERLERKVAENHPYETPQWVCVEAQKVSEKYLKWASEAASVHRLI